jgi:penicillin G amidase
MIPMSEKTDSQQSSPARKPKRWLRWSIRVLTASLLVLFGLIGWGYWRLRSSLPILDGTVRVPTLAAEVTIDRDEQGVPSIRANTRNDAAYALGYAHAQDRFFQMDLLRRMSAGRLGELVGEAALRADRNFRRHRFDDLVQKVLLNLPSDKKSILEAYTVGVNDGLNSLGDYPFEYLLLQQKPRSWEEADSLLVMMTMLCDLQPMDGRNELGLGELREKVPIEVFDFLVRHGSHWDAALDGSQLPMPTIPAAELFSLRGQPMLSPPTYLAETEPAPYGFSPNHADIDFVIGSNNWAVSGKIGKDSKAILASDMHLGLQVPTIWYRAFIESPAVDGKQRRMIGVTLPGTPVLIEGSNGSVAWGFTNSYGDYGDIVELKQTNNKNKKEYLTASGPRELITYKDVLLFPGGKEAYEYQWSEWGPVVETRDERLFVHCWVGNDPNAFDLNLMDMEATTSVEQALDVANRSGMPNQNVTVVDSAGNIGWTLSGRIPKRPGKPPLTPVDWSTGEGTWLGYLDPTDYPRVYNPPEGRIWTANNRIMGEDYLRKVGDGRFDPGARARQIRDRLLEKEMFAESDLLSIQLDDEARFMATWKDRLLKVAADHPDKLSSDLVKHVNQSSQHAAIDAIGYRIVSEFRGQVMQRIFGIDTARGRTSEPPQFTGLAKKIGLSRNVSISRDAVADQLLIEQPPHWIPAEYESWSQLLLEAAVATETRLTQSEPLTEATWGKRNQAAIRHPLSMAVSALSSFLDMESLPLPGDSHMPRVQSPSGGASQRMVVSPGAEEQGIYHQPGGQSGHPLSPFYRLGYEDWAYGKASRLLPGESKHQIKLVPSSAP